MKRRRYRKPPGLVIEYMQVRLPTKRARPLILRQWAIIQGFAQEFGVPIHMWYARATDRQPRPTPEELIEAGLVYCIVATNWDKLPGCEGHWPPLYDTAAAHKVRRILIREGADFSYYDEGSVFWHGWQVTGPKRPDWRWRFDQHLIAGR